MRIASSPLQSSRKSNNPLLLFIAGVTFLFAVVKMPLEMEILSRAVPQRRSIHDFYNHRAPRSEVDQRIDAKRSYSHMFNRGQQRSLRAVEDEEMALKVDEIVHRYLNGEQEPQQRRLRDGMDKDMLTERVQHLVERFLGHEEETEEDMEVVGAVPHQHKEDDPFDRAFSEEIQDIVNRYTEKSEM
jgi:hypothetical protein